MSQIQGPGHSVIAGDPSSAERIFTNQKDRVIAGILLFHAHDFLKVMPLHLQ